MNVFDFVGKFILFIIPGTISLSIITYLTGKKISVDTLNTIYIFALSGISYAICNFIIALLNFIPKMDLQYANISEIMTGKSNAISTIHIILSIISSFVLGMLLTWILSKNILFKVSNKLKISHRTDNQDLWDKLFDVQPWIIFRDYVTNYTYYGRVNKASDNKDEREIILEDVTVYNDQSDEMYTMKQIYFCRKPSEFSIEIDDYTKGDVSNATGQKQGLFVQA